MLRFLVLALSFISCLALAEQPKYVEPDEKTLQQAKKSMSQVMKSTDKLIKNNNFLEEIKKQQRNIDLVNGTAQLGMYDLSSISTEIKEDRFLSKAIAAGKKIQSIGTESWTSAPIILVSLSMPEDALRSLIKEAAKVGSPVVLNGVLDNSIEKTMTRIRKLAGEESIGGIVIDPTLFERFSVTTAPTFVLPVEPVKTCDQDGCEVPRHIKAHGAATLEYFLEKASILGNEEEKEVAQKWLNVYKGEA